ncbi:MAG: hypothetical protein EBU08_21155, partial [Micrococcales bacterium]|nr:hypothetical protein [Micrococcales bacterium]
GAQYISGLSISNYTTSGNGSNNNDATIAISNGILYQEDIEINIVNSISNKAFHQNLNPIAKIPVYYHNGTSGQWTKNTATNYPIKYTINGPQYNLLTNNNWTIADVSPGGSTRFFAMWILATNQINDPIIAIMGQRVDSNPIAAENNNNWSDINLTNLPINELKPLYRLIFAGDSDFTNVPKSYLYSILDLRVTVINSIVGIPQNDHGNLFGLGDDDHAQYVHINENRTIEASHSFINGLVSNGLINSVSGNFTNLTVNNTGVSISGHSHTASDITNFNTSVSGLVSGIYAPLNSPVLTGIPTVPTADSGINNNQIASTAFVRTAISNLVASAPSTLDTLNELAAALGNDANFSTSITNSLAGKANLNGSTFTGAISSPSGNFTSSLLVNGTAVSVSGHTHTTNNILDFETAIQNIIIH